MGGSNPFPNYVNAGLETRMQEEIENGKKGDGL